MKPIYRLTPPSLSSTSLPSSHNHVAVTIVNPSSLPIHHHRHHSTLTTNSPFVSIVVVTTPSACHVMTPTCSSAICRFHNLAAATPICHWCIRAANSVLSQPCCSNSNLPLVHPSRLLCSLPFHLQEQAALTRHLVVNLVVIITVHHGANLS